MAAANTQLDKVLVEGWWLKKAGKGNANLIDRKVAKHRYFILTERYLDWYEKPGYPRKGCLPLDQMFVRKHGDSVSLVIGQFGGKEFKITSEGKDPAGRIDDWYDRIINQMDVCKQRNQHGADRKAVVQPGFDDKGAQARVVATGQVTMTQQPQIQATLQVQNANGTVSVTPITSQQQLEMQKAQLQQQMLQQQQALQQQQQAQQQQLLAQQAAQQQQQQQQLQQQMMNMQMQSQMQTQVPQMNVQPVRQMQPQMTVQQVQPQIIQTVQPASPYITTAVPHHTTTAIGPYGQTTTYTSAPAVPAPVTATTTYGPYGAQTTYSQPSMQPSPTVTRTTYGPYGAQTTVTQTAAPTSAVMTCMACRAQFQAPIGGLVRCPYCQFVSGGGVQTVVAQPTMMQVGYAPAPFY